MNKHTELISVVVPVYNASESVEATLQSIINQTYKNFEILVINDGSTDDSQEVIEELMLTYPNIKLISQANAGVSSARNKGIENSSGKYISFLDSDDMFDPTFLEKMINSIVKASADYCYCGYNVISNNSIKKKRTANFAPKSPLKNYILGKLKLHTSTWLIKKDLLFENNIRFSENLNWGEDFEFFCKVLAYGATGSTVKEYLTYYVNEEGDKRLSSHSLDKIEKDYFVANNLANDAKINISPEINKAILNYRLNGTLTSRLLVALSQDGDSREILSIYQRYKEYIKPSFNNGLRSIKLNIKHIKLKKAVKKLTRN